MEKTITIGKRDINFKATGGTLCIYKQQFGTEYCAELAEQKRLEESGERDMKKLLETRYETGFRLVWAMAKNADPSLPDPERWLSGFKEFPLTEILYRLNGLFKAAGQDESDGEGLTSEGLMACAVACGFTKEDVYSLPIDFLVGCIRETVDIKSGKQRKKDTVRDATQQDMLNF